MSIENNNFHINSNNLDNLANKQEPLICKSEIQEKFEHIKTPEELLTFMKSNIKYGFVGKDDNKIYSPEHEDWGISEEPVHDLQSPEKLLVSKHGTCWDQTELERSWFAKHNYEFKTFLSMVNPGKEISQKNPAHTFLTYKDGEKWKWFENSLGDDNGIYEFTNLGSVIDAVKERVVNNAIRNGATEEELKNFMSLDYEKPILGCDTNKFVLDILNKKS
jgi:hypothetical protein